MLDPQATAQLTGHVEVWDDVQGDVVVWRGAEALCGKWGWRCNGGCAKENRGGKGRGYMRLEDKECNVRVVDDALL